MSGTAAVQASEDPLGNARDGRRPTMRDVAARAQVSF